MLIEKRKLISAFLVLSLAMIGVIFNSPLLCRICVFLLLAWCIVKGKQENYLLNPYYLFAFTPFSLLIYSNISRYLMDLTVDTWLLAIINMASFVVAFEITPNYSKTYKCKGAGEEQVLIQNTLFLMILGFLPSLYKLLIHSTMPLASVMGLFSTASIVCAMKSKKKWLILLDCAVTVFFWLGYVSKSAILAYCVALLISYDKYYLESPKQKRRLVFLSIFAVIIMIAAFSFANQGRGSESGLSAVEYYTKYGNLTWDGNAYLLMPYMYLTTPWANLQYVMQTQNFRTFGLWLLKPILGYLQIDNVFASYYSMRAYSNFNTFTFIAVQYKDFGFFGSCISSAFLGFFAKKVYSRYICSRSPFDVACYALTARAVLEMFFSNEFFTQSFPFTIVIIMGIYKAVFSKGNEVELE